jgi:hypothetical protein
MDRFDGRFQDESLHDHWFLGLKDPARKSEPEDSTTMSRGFMGLLLIWRRRDLSPNNQGELNHLRKVTWFSKQRQVRCNPYQISRPVNQKGLDLG